MEPDPSQSPVETLLTDYAEALGSLSPMEDLSSRQVLRVLRSRDRLQSALTESLHLADDQLARLSELDLTLKQHSDRLSSAENLDQLRQSLQPPDSAWWWHLSPPDPKPARFSKFDWLWNLGTVASLVLATSFATQTAKAFSTEGFDFLGTLSTIGQGAGLVFVAGGALTDRGKRGVSHVLNSLKVPPSLHAEATFGASLLLLGATYSINQNLHYVSNWYFARGQQHEHQSEWSQAFESYKRALNFSPDDYRTLIATGFLHEKLGNFEQAIAQYQRGSAFGIPEFLNAQGRALLMQALQKNSWQGGIDAQVITEAERLLQRADRSSLDLRRGLGKTRPNERLYTDILVNQAIAKLAGISATDSLTPEIQSQLEDAFDLLARLKSVKTEETSTTTNALADASTLGKVRTDCFYEESLRMADTAQLARADGIDFFLQVQEYVYACGPLRWQPSLTTTPDSLLITNYRLPKAQTAEQAPEANVSSLSSFMETLYVGSDYEAYGLPEGISDRIALIQEPETWQQLAQTLTTEIQTNLSGETTEGGEKGDRTVIWRFLISREGEIFAAFAYDDLSRSNSSLRAISTQAREERVFEQLISQVAAGETLEFADFKVVLSTDGKILHLLPWGSAYPSYNESYRAAGESLLLSPEAQAAFPRYTPDLTDAAEQSALQAVIYAAWSRLAIDTKQGAYLEEPALYRLTISSDGQVVKYQAANAIATQKFGQEFPLINPEGMQFPAVQKAPYLDFEFEFRGLPSRIRPWPGAQPRRSVDPA